MIAFLLNAFKIIFVLGFLVLIHEGGHFLVAKLFNVKVNEFSIGFGKQILVKQTKETKYTFRIFPFGGYVSMLGEEEKSEEERSFSKQSIPRRIGILAAGGIVNILFGLIVYFVLIACMGDFSSKTVDYLVEDYGAEIAGVLPNDEIVEINGKHVFIVKDLNKELAKSGKTEVSIKVKRNGELKEIKLLPTEVKNKSIDVYFDTTKQTKVTYMNEDSPSKNLLEIGDVILEVNGQDVRDDYKKLVKMIKSSENNVVLKVERKGEEKEVTVVPKEFSSYYIGAIFKPASKDFATRMYYSWFTTGDFVLSIVDNVKTLFMGKVSTNQMMGPIGISKTVVSTNTLYDFVYLLSLISLSLGVTNLLPFPALDGGKIFILLIEAIRRKPMKENTEIVIQMIGFSLLILLSIYISYIDILRFF